MKTVCHVISGYFRNDARVFRRQCLSLKDAGYDVSILTCDGEPDEILEGVKIFSCDRKWPRRLTLMLAKYQFIGKALEINADIYQLHSPELLSLGVKLKKLGKRIVYDAHEDMGAHILEKEWLPTYTRRILSFLVTRYMNFVYRKIDEVISPHLHVVNQIKTQMNKGVLVANFPWIKPLSRTDTVPIEQRELVLCYAGTVYPYSNQEQVIKAIASMPNSTYEIAGHIEDQHKESLRLIPGIHELKFYDRLTQDELRKLFLRSLIGVVVYDYKLNLGYDMGSYGTNKLFEYMEAGLPVICTDFILWKEIVDKYECGICVKPGDISSIVDAIETIHGDRALAARMGANARAASIEKYNWDSEKEKYLSTFECL